MRRASPTGLVTFRYVQQRAPDKDGDQEVLDGLTFTHHIVDGPGDEESVSWHYVETGEGEPIVFLHGIPDSWYQWHHQMSALSATHRCIAVDLKGYGQSETRPGEYRHEGVAEQLYAMLQSIGVTRFNLVTHDRGTVQADFIASQTSRKPSYATDAAKQHLFHFNPDLAPQGEIFMNAPWTGLMEDPVRFIVWVYTWITERPIPDAEVERVIQEFWYHGVSRAVPRYFKQFQLPARMAGPPQSPAEAWRCPILIIARATTAKPSRGSST